MPFGTWEEAVQWLIKQPDQEQLVRDCYFDQPLGAAAERYWNSPEWDAIRVFIPRRKGTALDLGAGQGVSALPWLRMVGMLLHWSQMPTIWSGPEQFKG